MGLKYKLMIAGLSLIVVAIAVGLVALIVRLWAWLVTVIIMLPQF